MLERTRNIGIIAHVDAGKTTTTERILFLSGAKHRLGGVDTGDSTTDYDPAERKRGITINSAAVTIEWGEARITLIDTPGHVDFTAEVERSLRVLDGAVCVFCAVGGVQVQSETVWHQAGKHGVPLVGYVNKMDRRGADFFGCLDQMRQRLGAPAVPVAIPAGAGDEFDGVIDLVEMRWSRGDQGVPERHRAEAELWRRRLLEAASAFDDELLAAVVEGREVPAGQLKAALRRGTLGRKLVPVLCGSSHSSQGVPLLLDCVVDYLPSPACRGEVVGTCPRTGQPVARRPDPAGPLAALAFKTVAGTSGDLVFVRVYSGTLRPKDEVLNATAGGRERVSRVYRMMGDRQQPLEAAGPGDIVALVGPRSAATGHTLCSAARPVVLEAARFPEPVVSVAVIPARGADETKLADALARLVRDDPTLRLATDPQTRQLVLSGMGELHLEVSMEKLLRNPGVKASAGKPMVAYRQTVSRAALVETRHIKQTGGRGQYAVIHCRFEPLPGEAGGGVEFASEVVGGAVRREFVAAVEAGFREACRRGHRFGFPLVGVRCTLFDGKEHEKDSNFEAFRVAAMECTREAQRRAGVALLEPIMAVVVSCNEAHQGAVIGDVNRRRGRVERFECDGGRSQVRATVPLAELFGYAGELRNVTGGTASFSMEPSHYAPVREELAGVMPAQQA